MYVVTLAFQKVGSKAPLHLQPYLDWGELLILSQCHLHPVSAPMLRDSSETGSAAEHVSNIHPVGAKVDCVGCRGGGRSESISCRCLCSWTVWQTSESPYTLQCPSLRPGSPLGSNLSVFSSSAHGPAVLWVQLLCSPLSDLCTTSSLWMPSFSPHRP